MARYIDADELYRRVKRKTNPYGKPTLDYESGVKVLEMIEQEPTADVVPKSELAREIFEEIEQWLGNYNGCRVITYEKFDELKKKYTEDEK